MLGTICVRLLDGLSKAVARPLLMVETGTMFQTWLESGEKDLSQRSTFAIARWMKQHGGTLHSIDEDADHIATSAETLASHGLDHGVAFYRGNSAAVLRSLDGPFDFALLDSATEPEVILSEFQAIVSKLSRPSIVVIDDCFKAGEGVNKGALAVPVAERMGLRQWPIARQARAIALGTQAERIVQEVARAL